MSSKSSLPTEEGLSFEKSEGLGMRSIDEGEDHRKARSIEKREERHEAVKILHATYHTHFWESAKILTRSFAFYIAIVAALLGYVLTQKLPIELARGLIGGAILISLIHFVGMSSWCWALTQIVCTLEGLSKQLDNSLHSELGLDRTFARWRTFIMIVTINTVLVGAIIVVGMFLLLTSLK